MIIHDNSDAAKYFVKGLEYMKDKANKKSIFTFNNKKIKQSEAKEKLGITLIATTKKESIDYIREIIKQKHKSGYEIDQMLIVIVDYFKDSMIRSKYIKGKLLRGNKTKLSPSYVFVDFNELDKITQIEDDYNQCFSFKELSRHYKKQLRLVADLNVENTLNEIKENSEIEENTELEGKIQGIQMTSHNKGGRDFANSTLV